MCAPIGHANLHRNHKLNRLVQTLKPTCEHFPDFLSDGEIARDNNRCKCLKSLFMGAIQEKINHTYMYEAFPFVIIHSQNSWNLIEKSKFLFLPL